MTTTYHPEHRLRFQTADGHHPLATRAFELHAAAAASQGQVWSADHASAFRELHQAYVLTTMGAGAAQRTAWPLACGTGKTQSLVAFAKAQSEQRAPASLLVCIESVEHISGLYRDMINAGVPKRLLAVFHSKTANEVKKRGLTPAATPDQIDAAPFLIATHSRMLRGDESIAKVNTYRGKPRQLIVWDESLIKSKGLFAELVDIERAFGVLNPTKSQNGDASDAAKYLSQCLEFIREFHEKDNCASPYKGSDEVHETKLLELPQVSDDDDMRYRVGLEIVLAGRDGTMQATAKEHLTTFLEHSQRPLRVLSALENGHSVGIIQYETIIPDSLKNLIVLDASHNIRALTSQHDTTLRATTVNCAVKSFDEVTVTQYVQGAGRDKLATELLRAASPTTERVLAVLSAYPADEGVVIVTFKPRGTYEKSNTDHLQRHMRKAGLNLKAKLPNGKDRFVFLTWGKHVGVSQFAYCRHALAVGVTRREGFDIASAIAGQRGDLTTAHSADVDSVRDTIVSEMFHHVIQFAGRGNCRTTINGQAGKMSLTLFCNETFPEAWWQQAMPGVSVTELRPDAAVKAAQTDANLQLLAGVIGGLPYGVDYIASRTLKVKARLQPMHSNAFTRLLAQLTVDGWERAGRGLRRVSPFKDETAAA